MTGYKAMNNDSTLKQLQQFIENNEGFDDCKCGGIDFLLGYDLCVAKLPVKLSSSAGPLTLESDLQLDTALGCAIHLV